MNQTFFCVPSDLCIKLHTDSSCSLGKVSFSPSPVLLQAFQPAPSALYCPQLASPSFSSPALPWGRSSLPSFHTLHQMGSAATRRRQRASSQPSSCGQLIECSFIENRYCLSQLNRFFIFTRVQKGVWGPDAETEDDTVLLVRI